MAGKLTEEQRAEIVGRYQVGESCTRLARCYDVTEGAILNLLRTRSVPRRPQSCKLSESQKEELIRRYRAGATGLVLAQEFGISKSLANQIVAEAGATRSAWEIGALRTGNDNLLATAQASHNALWEAYSGPGSGYPSLGMLADRWGISINAVRARLIAAGIKPRTQSEQQRLDARQKRRNWLVGRNGHRWTPTDYPAPRPRGAQWRARISASKTTRQAVPCYWCGARTEKHLCELSKWQRAFCHRGCYTAWRRWKASCDCGARPLILEKLRDLLVHPNGIRIAHPTYDQLQKLGAAFGAGEPEIEAILLETRGP